MTKDSINRGHLQECLTIICGQHTHFITLRCPRDLHDPTQPTDLHPIKFGKALASELVRLGLSCQISHAFSPARKGHAEVLHYHGTTNGPLPDDFCRRFRAKFGPRAVDVRKIKTSPGNAERLAAYQAKQAHGLIVGCLSVVRAVCIEDEDQIEEVLPLVTLPPIPAPLTMGQQWQQRVSNLRRSLGRASPTWGRCWHWIDTRCCSLLRWLWGSKDTR